MKKTLKTLFAISLTLASLTSCNRISSNLAEKITAAYKSESKDDDYTYEKVLTILGTPAIDNTGAGVILGNEKLASGTATWYQNCKTKAEADEKVNSGKKVKMITVTFSKGIATKATYSVRGGD